VAACHTGAGDTLFTSKSSTVACTEASSLLSATQALPVLPEKVKEMLFSLTIR
jgi:hypothetical protein